MQREMQLKNLSGRVICLMQYLALFLLFSASSAFAGPADSEPVLLSNPDGVRFQATIRGDEFQNWLEAENGYTIVRNEGTKYWEYAEMGADETLMSSGMVFQPGKSAPKGLRKGLKPRRNSRAEADFNLMLQEIYQERVLSPSTGDFEAAAGDWIPAPVSGTKKVLVIMVNFADRALVTTADGWNSKLFDNTPGAKSLVRYYTDNSYGMVTISPAAHNQIGNPAGIITVTVSDNHPNSGSSSNFTIESTILNHALAQAAQYIDFASYDTSGDGILQQSELNIYFIYAGYEASGTTKTPSIWAHAWGGTGVTAGGKQVRKWAMNGELNNADLQHPMGVIAHEMGHSICGFPDLYDTFGYNAGLGTFSLMAAGSWGADTSMGESGGTTPTALDAWSRQYVGWATPVTPSAGTTINFPLPLSSQTSSSKFGAATIDASEYFLAENRYPNGWDLGLKRYLGSNWQGGLLVLHVDITSGTVGFNNINRYDTNPHQGVMVEEASSADCAMATYTCRGKPTNLFYAGHRDSFTDLTLPNTRYYNDTSAQFGLTSISAPGEVMTAVVSAAPAITRNHPADNASGVGMGASISISFNKEIDASTVNGSTFRLNQGVTPVAGTVSYDAGSRTATFTPSSPLAANTSYSALLTTEVRDQGGNPLGGEKTWSFTTGTAMLQETFDTWFKPAGWTLRDNAASGAKWTFDDQHKRYNWTGGSGGFAIIDSDLFGEVSVDAELRTPVMDLSGFNNAQLSFKTDFYHYSTEIADVDVSIDGGGTWTNIWRKSGLDYRVKTETLDISQFARNQNVVIRFRYYNAYWEWFWSVDDVTVSVSSPVPVSRTLNASVAGLGSGTVTVTPGGIAFNTSYTGQFDGNSLLILTPSAAEYSVFSGWSGACTGTGDCSLTMDSDKSVTAAFEKDHRKTKIDDTNTHFSTLQAAYNGAPESSTINVWGTEFTENLNCAIQKDVSLEGGYNGAYTGNNGYTTLKGSLTIASGSLAVENFVIQ